MKKIINHLKKNWIRHGFETLVVIVGVLIAFTLNDWNEYRKSKRFESKLKIELYNSIQNDIPLLDSAIRAIERIPRSCEAIDCFVFEYFPENRMNPVAFIYKELC